jgi:hypothetical protein
VGEVERLSDDACQVATRVTLEQSGSKAVAASLVLRFT